MRLLLDTHALIWAVENPSRLGLCALRMLQDPSHVLLLSAGSVWEVAIKTGLGKLILSYPFRQWMMRAIADLEIEILPVTIEYADLQATLPDHHRDPFDRLIAAQSIIENAPLVSNDVIFDRYGLVRLWN